MGLINSIDKIVNSITKIGTNFFLWFFWIFYAIMMTQGISEQGLGYLLGNSKGESSFNLLITSIWLWGTIRYLKRKGLLGKLKSKSIRKEKLITILLNNIIAPVIVSIVLQNLTGRGSFTLISIPVLSYFTASISIGE